VTLLLLGRSTQGKNTFKKEIIFTIKLHKKTEELYI